MQPRPQWVALGRTLSPGSIVGRPGADRALILLRFVGALCHSEPAVSYHFSDTPELTAQMDEVRTLAEISRRIAGAPSRLPSFGRAIGGQEPSTTCGDGSCREDLAVR